MRGRLKNDVELVTQENIVVETVEKVHEVTSTLFVDNCAVSDEGDVKVVAENKAGVASHVAKLTVLGQSSLVFICLTISLLQVSIVRLTPNLCVVV